MNIDCITSQVRILNDTTTVCLVNGCKNNVYKILSFHGKQEIKPEIFNTKINCNNNVCTIGCCTQHIPYMNLLGYAVSISQCITSDTIQRILLIPLDEINTIIQQYEFHNLLVHIKKITEKCNKLSIQDIYTTISKIITYYEPAKMSNQTDILHSIETYLLYSTAAVSLFYELRNAIMYFSNTENIHTLNIYKINIIRRHIDRIVMTSQLITNIKSLMQ